MMQNIGMNMFTPSNELVGDLQTECTNLRPEQQMCTNAYFLFNGYDSQSLNLVSINNHNSYLLDNNTCFRLPLKS